MKILSIDTSSNICGVSILDNNNLICNLDKETGRTHSEILMPMIDSAFKKSNLSLKDIGLIICDIGPGSFTGIRIGIATVKAFSDSLNIPCVGVSSLESLAYNVNFLNDCKVNYTGNVCSILDCKNSNCYFALYQFKDGVCKTIIEPMADTVQNALVTINNLNLPDDLLFIGDGSLIYKDEIIDMFPNCIFASGNSNLLNSYSLALAGIDKYFIADENKDNKEDIFTGANLLPMYLRKPQAQRQLEAKMKEFTNSNKSEV